MPFYCYGSKILISEVAHCWNTSVFVIGQHRIGAVPHSHQHWQPAWEWCGISLFSCHSSASSPVLSQEGHYGWLSSYHLHTRSCSCTTQRSLFHQNSSDLLVEMLTKLSVSVLARLQWHPCPLIQPHHASNIPWSCKPCRRTQPIHHLQACSPQGHWTPSQTVRIFHKAFSCWLSPPSPL